MNRIIFCCISVVFCSNLAITSAKSYMGGELFSRNTVKYGRFDVRMRMVSKSGVVSSFFLYYDNSYMGSPEPWQEIDIEVIGKKPNSLQTNIISGTAASKITSEKIHTVDNLAGLYHTYTVEWAPNYTAWFFNGKEIRRTTGSQVTALQAKEMSYRFNLWISDNPGWVGQFNESILPVYQLINWIAYSKYTPGSGPNGTDFTPEWREEFDSFNSSLWGKGDWTFGGNLVDFSPNNIIVKDGYCILCLTKSTSPGFSGEVPKDQDISSINKKPHGSIRMPAETYLNHYPSFIVSLDGRLFKETQLMTRNSALWVKNHNNSTIHTLNIAR